MFPAITCNVSPSRPVTSSVFPGEVAPQRFPRVPRSVSPVPRNVWRSRPGPTPIPVMSLWHTRPDTLWPCGTHAHIYWHPRPQDSGPVPHEAKTSVPVGKRCALPSRRPAAADQPSHPQKDPPLDRRRQTNPHPQKDPPSTGGDRRRQTNPSRRRTCLWPVATRGGGQTSAGDLRGFPARSARSAKPAELGPGESREHDGIRPGTFC